MPVTSETPVTFSRDELRSIRRELRLPRHSPTCPRCQATLQIHGGISGSGYQMVHVRCVACCRVAFIGELPNERWVKRGN
jgi:hypothetical protein